MNHPTVTVTHDPISDAYAAISRFDEAKFHMPTRFRVSNEAYYLAMRIGMPYLDASKDDAGRPIGWTFIGLPMHRDRKLEGVQFIAESEENNGPAFTYCTCGQCTASRP